MLFPLGEGIFLYRYALLPSLFVFLRLFIGMDFVSRLNCINFVG